MGAISSSLSQWFDSRGARSDRQLSALVAKRLGIPIHTWIVIVSLSVLLFIAALWTTSVIAWRTGLQRSLSRDDHVLQLYVASIRRDLYRYQYLPELLARDYRLRDLLREPSPPARRVAANRYLELAAGVSGAAAIYLIAPSGLTLAASNWRQTDSFVGHNYGFRPYFKQAMQGRLGRYYALGTASQQRGYYFTFPVREQGRISGVVTVKVPLDSLENTHDTNQYDFVVTDPNGVVFLSTRPAWRYHTLAPLTPAEHQRINASRRYAGRQLPPLQVTRRRPFGGSATLLSIDTSGQKTSYIVHGVDMPSAGWRVRIFSATADIKAYVFHTVLLAGLGLAALLLISLIFIQRRHQLAERMRFEGAALETAAANEARVRAIIDGTTIGLVTLDWEGRIQSFNPTAESIFDQTVGAVEGLCFSALIADSAQSEFHIRLQQAVAAAPELTTVELVGLGRSGRTFPMEAAINRVIFPDGLFFIISLRDISERKAHEAMLMRDHDALEGRVAERTADLVETNKQLLDEITQHQRTEAELRRTRGELVQTAKLATIGQLSAGINHEINQPLTAIRFYASNALVFLDRSKLPELRENLLHISALTGRIGRIVTELKLFARKSSGQPVTVPIGAVLDGALALLVPRFRSENTRAIKRLPDEELLCLGDTVLLEQVFVNLISNAMQSMAGLDDKRIEVTAGQVDDGHVQVKIRDFGTGIAPSNMKQIFDAFFTTKDAGTGLGLGLSISLRIIEDLNGSIRADNHPDGGAVFTVELPAAPPPV